VVVVTMMVVELETILIHSVIAVIVSVPLMLVWTTLMRIIGIAVEIAVVFHSTVQRTTFFVFVLVSIHMLLLLIIRLIRVWMRAVLALSVQVAVSSIFVMVVVITTTSGKSRTLKILKLLVHKTLSIAVLPRIIIVTHIPSVQVVVAVRVVRTVCIVIEIDIHIGCKLIDLGCRALCNLMGRQGLMTNILTVTHNIMTSHSCVAVVRRVVMRLVVRVGSEEWAHWY